jgi:hypothetical protein
MPSLNFSEAWPWLQWVIAVSVVLGVIFGAIRGIPPAWRFVSRVVFVINSLVPVATFMVETKDTLAKQNLTLAKQDTVLARQDRKIAEIHHEVHFNNGTSVKDGVVRTEALAKKALEEIEALKPKEKP